MDLHSQLKQMARSSHWQEIYSASKACSGIRLFENDCNFSGIQRIFLYYLRVYDMLYSEMHQLEWGNLTEAVIEDNDRLDAFLYWRSKQQEKKLREYRKSERNMNKKSSKGQRFPIYKGPKNKQEGDK